MISQSSTEGDPALRDVEPGSDADATPVTQPEPTPPAERPRETEKPEARDFDEKAEVHFLADEFGIAPLAAAGMVVAGESEAETIAAAVMAEERERDPLAGLPVPGPDKDPDHLEKEIADLEKPVVHRPSAPT
jgi:hypothetical protein